MGTRLRQHPEWILLLGGVLAVLPGLFMGLHADDWFHLRARPLSTVLATFAGDWNEGVSGEGGFYRPLVRLSFHFDHAIHGLRDWGYHATNGVLFLALLAGVYTSAVLLCGGPRLGPALAILLLLALHPLKNEALYWVSGRTDLLASAFLLWAFALTLLALRAGRMKWAVGALAFLAGGLLSKEVALAGAAILPLTVFLLASGVVPKRVRRVLIWGPPLLGLLYLALRFAALGGLGGYSVPGPPRSTLDFGENGVRMVSALLWPWQADAEGPFRLKLALPGLLAGAAVLAVGGSLQRRLLVCAGAMLLALLPMIPVEPRAGDGARVLLAPLCFLVTGVTVLLWHGERKRWMDGAKVAGLAVLALTLQSANLTITRDFLAAAGPNRAALAHARAWIEGAPEEAALVLQEAPLDRHRRILHPGSSLLMAAQTWWHEHPGATSEGLADQEEGLFALRLMRDGQERLAAQSVQSWMQVALLVRPTGDGAIEARILRRGDAGFPPRTVSREMLTLLHEPLPGHLTAWELTGVGWDGSTVLLEATLESGGMIRVAAEIYREDGTIYGWIDDGRLRGAAVTAADLRLPWLREGILQRSIYEVIVEQSSGGK